MGDDESKEAIGAVLRESTQVIPFYHFIKLYWAILFIILLFTNYSELELEYISHNPLQVAIIRETDNRYYVQKSMITLDSKIA